MQLELGVGLNIGDVHGAALKRAPGLQPFRGRSGHRNLANVLDEFWRIPVGGCKLIVWTSRPHDAG